MHPLTGSHLTFQLDRFIFHSLRSHLGGSHPEFIIHFEMPAIYWTSGLTNERAGQG